MKRCTFLTNALALALILNLSGLTTVLSTAWATQPAHSGAPKPGMDHLAEFFQESGTLDKNLGALLRRAKHPDSPGTTGGIPSFSEVLQVEKSFLAWKKQIERIVSLPSVAPVPYSEDFAFPPELKREVINTYLSEFSKLVTLRIALGFPHDPRWRAPFGLEISKTILKEIPGATTTIDNGIGGKSSPLVVDRGVDGRADPVRLQLSESWVQGLEVGALSNHPTDSNFLTLIQFLATSQLLQNLASLRYLKADRSTGTPVISPTLQSKLQSLGMADVIQDEQRQIEEEPATRAALSEAFKRIEKQLPPFATLELTQAIARVITRDPKEQRKQALSLLRGFYSAETSGTAAPVTQDIQNHDSSFGAMPEAELLPLLREFASNGRATALIDHLIESFSKGPLKLTPEQRTQIADLIEARRVEFARSIPESTLTRWSRTSESLKSEDLHSGQYNRFVSTLIHESQKVARLVRESFAGSRVDLTVLAGAFAPELQELKPRSSVMNWLYQIVGEPDYFAARNKYAQIMVGIAGPNILLQGIVEPALVYQEYPDLKPELEFSRDVNPELARKVTDRVAKGRKKDLRDLLKIGGWMGFHRPFTQVPSVQDVIPWNKSKQRDYFSALEDRILSQYPVFSMEVVTSTASGGHASAKLYDALASLSCAQQISKQTLEEASLLVDQALIQREKEILDQIQAVGESTNLAELEQIITSSMATELVMKSFAEFGVQQERFIEAILVPSLIDQIMHRYVGRYLGAGFGALILIHIAKKTITRIGPWIDVVLAPMQPVISAYMKSTIAVILADTAYQISEVAHTRGKMKKAEALFATSVGQGSLLMYGELNAARTQYQFSKWFFVGRLAMDIPFMYWPILKEGLGKMATQSLLKKLQRDAQGFELLGLELGKWDQVEVAYQRLIGDSALTPAGRTELDWAHSWLTGQIQAKKIWSPEALRSRQPTNELEKRLIELMSPAAGGEAL